MFGNIPVPDHVVQGQGSLVLILHTNKEQYFMHTPQAFDIIQSTQTIGSRPQLLSRDFHLPLNSKFSIVYYPLAR